MEKDSSKSPQTKFSSVKSSAEKTTEETAKALTVLWHQLPTWQQDNHYIHSGYRPASNSYSLSIKSLGYLHNESVNVYSHLIGALLSLVSFLALFNIFSSRYALATSDDILVISCYFLGAIACLGMSTTYHLISNHSEEVAKWGNKLDYLGIVVLIWGSFIPTVYYGFQDDMSLVKLYWAMV
jgi:adiponectin receptor